MHVISKRKLQDFWIVHPRAKQPLDAWFRAAKRAEWESFQDVKKDFGQADLYDKFVIFDIGGNKYRLIAVIHYDRGKVFIRQVLTHAEYDRGKWKDD